MRKINKEINNRRVKSGMSRRLRCQFLFSTLVSLSLSLSLFSHFFISHSDGLPNEPGTRDRARLGKSVSYACRVCFPSFP
jgi:hypothetical protein